MCTLYGNITMAANILSVVFNLLPLTGIVVAIAGLSSGPGSAGPVRDYHKGSGKARNRMSCLLLPATTRLSGRRA